MAESTVREKVVKKGSSVPNVFHLSWSQGLIQKGNAIAAETPSKKKVTMAVRLCLGKWEPFGPLMSARDGENCRETSFLVTNGPFRPWRLDLSDRSLSANDYQQRGNRLRACRHRGAKVSAGRPCAQRILLGVAPGILTSNAPTCFTFGNEETPMMARYVRQMSSKRSRRPRYAGETRWLCYLLVSLARGCG